MSKKPLLEIKDLYVAIKGNAILQGLNLVVNPGEIHAVMGPNGAGKSTLAKVLAGHPDYEVTHGEIWFEGKNLLELEPPERSHAGMFVSFQYPVEVPGVSNWQFLFAACNAGRLARGEDKFNEETFRQIVDEKLKMLGMRSEFIERNVNEGFSGGEKKRNEILQMALLNPLMAILDETDSGLDIDALRAVAEGVNSLHTEDKGLLLITHYQRLLDFIKPTFVHVLMEGKIVKSGDADLARKLEELGYDWLVTEAGC